MQLQLVSHLFKLMIEQVHGLEVLHFIHDDCLEKVTKGILTLHSAGKENIVYQFLKSASVMSSSCLLYNKHVFSTGLVSFHCFTLSLFMKKLDHPCFNIVQELMLKDSYCLMKRLSVIFWSILLLLKLIKEIVFLH